jgi:DNA-directed RNA polymerase subunit RPC12/RpoP
VKTVECSLCGIWTCSACGWQRLQANPHADPGHDCFRCGSRTGVLRPTPHRPTHRHIAYPDEP